MTSEQNEIGDDDPENFSIAATLVFIFFHPFQFSVTGTTTKTTYQSSRELPYFDIAKRKGLNLPAVRKLETRHCLIPKEIKIESSKTKTSHLIPLLSFQELRQ